MATVKKTIGRLPVYKGDWVAGTYSMLNQVSYLGSTFQSKIDNNTSQPATLVNNVLQVNSNWNVISNGTAAYLADNRITSVEGKTTVLEQDVSVMRGDVQGVTANTQYVTISPDTKAVEILFDLSNCIKTNDSAIDIRLDNNNSYISVRRMSNGDTQCIVRDSAGGIYESSYRSYKKGHIVIGWKEYVTIHINGVQYLNKKIADGATINTVLYKICRTNDDTASSAIVNKIRFFNIPPTQQQIDFLYNQGRCDEVTLGSEWRNSNAILLNEYLPNFLTQTKWIDSGANKQDIVLTSPTFTYEKPYKKYSFGSGVPTTPPNAAFIEYSDTATGNIWKSGTKPNTREFAVTDWKQINN